MSLINELKNRNVIRVGAAYLVTAWLITQIVETVFPVYGFSDTAIRHVITALAIGFIPVLILAWVFEWTPDGIRKETDIDRSNTGRSGSKIFDRLIMVLLVVALGYFSFDKFILAEKRESAIAEVARMQGRSEAVINEFGDRSIAVLAFDDMSPDKDQEYMSDGIAEEILNLLAQVPDLRVISRSSAFSFKGQERSIPEIASQLGVAYILEGSVRKAGDQIRITAQLIEAGSDSHQWSQTYDRMLVNVFDIQDDIAGQVVGELKSAILGDKPRSQRLDENAYTLVLQARYLWYRRSSGDEEKALELYQQAVLIDPEYAPAWTGLSVAYAVAALKNRMDRQEGLDKAREAVERALKIDPEYGEAYVRLSQAAIRDGDMPGMLSALEQARQFDPHNPLVLGVLAVQAGREGRTEDVIRLYDAAADLDPLGSIWPGNKGSWLSRVRRADEAEVAIKRAFELNGNLARFENAMIDIHLVRQEFEQALEYLEKLPAEGVNQLRRSIAYFGTGQLEKSDAMLDQIKAEGHDLAKFGVASAYATRGEFDLAFEWLYKVENIPPWNLVYSHFTRLMVDEPQWKPWVDSLNWQWDYRY